MYILRFEGLVSRGRSAVPNNGQGAAEVAELSIRLELALNQMVQYVHTYMYLASYHRCSCIKVILQLTFIDSITAIHTLRLLFGFSRFGKIVVTRIGAEVNRHYDFPAFPDILTCVLSIAAACSKEADPSEG